MFKRNRDRVVQSSLAPGADLLHCRFQLVRIADKGFPGREAQGNTFVEV
jgi:hypothetical protein